MNGHQVAEVLMKEHPALAVVICSGCPWEIPECLQWYADAVVYKGDGPESLLSALESLVSAGTRARKPMRSIERAANWKPNRQRPAAGSPL